MSARRTEEFAKDELYEALLEEANAGVEGWGEVEGARPTEPILFVVGAPRSGTTLLYQLLASSGAFLYPSNLIARFYRAPAWGARLERLLKPILPRGTMTYASRAGNTEEWWGPHEFGYFWECHLGFGEHHEAVTPDLSPLCRALAAFQNEGGRPLLLKSNLLSFVLLPLAEALPTARFVWVRRDPLETAASIYRTRVGFHGDAETWWSVRPADAPQGASPAEQIAHQLSTVDGALRRARAELGERMIETEYRAICSDPRGVVRSAGALAGIALETEGLPSSFEPSRGGIEGELMEELGAALTAEGIGGPVTPGPGRTG